MRVSRLRLSVLLLAGILLARPAWAQARPAPDPTPRACEDCDTVEALRAQADEQREVAERRFEAALEAYDAMRQKDDSASRANYVLLRRRYDEARRAYGESLGKLMRLEAQRMQHEGMRMKQSLQMLNDHQPDGWLGVTFSGSWDVYSTSGHRVMRFNGYPVIETVEPDSPIEKAGVESGDTLVAIEGADVTKGTPTFKDLLHPGMRLSLKLKRGRTTVTRVVVVQKRPDEWTPMPGFAPPAPRASPPGEAPDAPEPPDRPEQPWPFMRTPLPPGPVVAPVAPGEITIIYNDEGTVAGAQVQKFDELKTYFGADSGVLVLRVLPGTSAARAGLKGGDVIVRANARTVTSPGQFAKLVGYARGGPVTLEIVRQRKKLTITLK